jgi:hypothetical protein
VNKQTIDTRHSTPASTLKSNDAKSTGGDKAISGQGEPAAQNTTAGNSTDVGLGDKKTTGTIRK